MKVILLARSLGIGGAERQLVLTAKGLHDHGIDVKVMIFYTGGELDNEIINHGIPLIDLKKRSRWDILIFIFRYFRIVFQEKPSIIYSYLNIPNILNSILKPFFRDIKIVWGVRSSDMDLSRYDWLSRAGFRLECLLSVLPDLVISNSFAGKKYYINQGFPSEGIAVIPNGMDSQKFKFDQHARERFRQEWNVGNDLLIGIIARLDPMKGHETFLKAADIFLKYQPNSKFLIVGSGPLKYKDHLLDISRKLGIDSRIIWTGSRNNVSEIYSALDIACSTSLFGEGFSNSVAEAMLSEVPCLVTDVGDSGLIVANSQWVSPPDDEERLCENLKLLSLELNDETKKNVRESIEKRFSEKIMITKTIEALQKITK